MMGAGNSFALIAHRVGKTLGPRGKRTTKAAYSYDILVFKSIHFHGEDFAFILSRLRELPHVTNGSS